MAMHLSITTPRGSIVNTEVEELTAPGVLGEFGILPGHIPFVSAIRPGVMLLKTGGATKWLAVGEGLLQIAPTPKGEQILVLVDQAVDAHDIDADAANKDALAIDHELNHWTKDLGGEYQALVIRRAWAQARIDARARSAGAH